MLARCHKLFVIGRITLVAAEELTLGYEGFDLFLTPGYTRYVCERIESIVSSIKLVTAVWVAASLLMFIVLVGRILPVRSWTMSNAH